MSLLLKRKHEKVSTNESTHKKLSKKDSGEESTDYLAPKGDVYSEQWRALGTWFLGPRAENQDVFLELFTLLFNKHSDLRRAYFPSDPEYITEEVRCSDAFQKEKEDLKIKLLEASEELGHGSVPFFSPRYQAHMLWDVTMPSLLGYMSAMLYNQNNVDTAASPVTTQYEKAVGLQLCDMLGYDIHNSPKPWGHITCGGSIANIEALWAARNIKFHSLAVKEAVEQAVWVGVLTERQKTKALAYKVSVPGKGGDIPLSDCEQWDLLNLDVDDICKLTNGVTQAAGLKDKDEIAKFDNWIEKNSYTAIGAHRFMNKHLIEQSPVYFCPANNHYSWPKGGTLLGLGSDSLIPVALDANFRQDVSELKKLLVEKLEKKVPVLSVTAVIGSTEESAVDPLSDILKLRDEMRSKGLNFCLLADAAWGGYFKTMLTDPPQEKIYDSVDFVPYTPLSDYVKEQYSVLQNADTITIDPHKSGFCPYPAGALCYRNGTMRAFIAIMHPEVYHGEDDPTMGVYGIEGSKPGAAPAGVLMSHKVIGLDSSGYGRILGQCTTTAKLFYCLWLVVARDDDPFICVPLQSLPEDYAYEKAKNIIRKQILGKPMYEIAKDPVALDLISKVGPDTLINTFVVNPKGNTKVSKANELQTALSDEMNVHVGHSAKRIDLILMQSGLNSVNHGEGLVQYKKRLGLQYDTGEDLSVMVNTTMNPWQWNESIHRLGDIFRNCILNCLGKVSDKEVRHAFVLCDDGADDGTVFADFIPDITHPSRQYHAVAKFQLKDEDIQSIRVHNRNNDGPLILRTHEKINLYSLLKEQAKKGILMNLYQDENWKRSQPLLKKLNVNILDVPRYQHIDVSKHAEYPQEQKYFLYGDETRTFLSHCISKGPDFHQVVSLDRPPHSLPGDMLVLGVEVSINTLQGNPLEVDDVIIDPLQAKSYTVSFRGHKNAPIRSTISMMKSDSKKFFKPLHV